VRKAQKRKRKNNNKIANWNINKKSRKKLNMEITIYIIIGLFIYFIPSIIGWNSKKASGIIVLNLFLGWTLLGWVGALIWAVSAPKEEKKQFSNTQKTDFYGKLISIKKTLLMQTEPEFENEEEINQYQEMLKEGEAIIKNKMTNDYKIVTVEQWEKILADARQNDFEIIEEK